MFVHIQHRLRGLRAAATGLCVSLICAAAASCSREPEQFRKVVVPVTGQAFVDGQPPDSPMQLEAHPVGGVDTEHPTVSTATTGEQGRFSFSTYESGDGLPPGQYKITVGWREFNALSGSFTGPDRLNSRYNTPDTSEISVTVEEGKPVDLGKLELTTK
jgi:hypothetical protein